MPSKVYAIASGKGGVGKTTTAANLGVSLRFNDRSTVIVDGDLGMPNLSEWFNVEYDTTLHQVMADDANVYQATITLAPGFAIIPGDDELDGFAEADPTRFAYVIDRLKQQYDDVILDTGGGLSFENVLPLQIADEVILVTSPNSPATKDTARTKELVEISGGNVSGVIVTKVRDSTDPREIAREIGVDLLGSIPFEDSIDDSLATGRPLEATNPDSDAAKAYREIGKNLLTFDESPIQDAQLVNS